MSSQKLTKSWLQSHALKNWGGISVVVLLTMTLSGLNIGVTRSIHRLIDSAISLTDVDVVVLLSIIAIGLALLQSGVEVVYGLAKSKLKEKVEEEIKRELAAKVLNGPVFSVRRREPGDLLSRILNDGGQAAGIIGNTVPALAYQLAMAIGAYIYQVWVDWRLALLVTSMAFLLPVIGRSMRGKLQNTSSMVQSALSDLTVAIQEVLDGLESIHAYRVQGEFLNRVSRRLRAKRLAALDSQKAVLMTTESSKMAGSLVFLSAIAYGSIRIATGELTPGGLVAFVQLLNWIVWPFTEASSTWARVQQGFAAADRLREILETEPDCGIVLSGTRGESAGVLGSKGVGISIKDLVVTYDQRETVLRNMNFDIAPGDAVCIVGRSGVGKTTLLKAILGLCRVNSGEVRFWKPGGRNGEPITVAYVRQEPWLFSGTILENIRIANSESSFEDVKNAASQAFVDEFVVRFPNQWNTELGERGTQLSGGQRKRIELARVFLRVPDLVILDEPTSEIDQDSERYILEALGRLKGKTTLVVATHSPALMGICDRHLVLDEQGGRGSCDSVPRPDVG